MSQEQIDKRIAEIGALAGSIMAGEGDVVSRVAEECLRDPLFTAYIFLGISHEEMKIDLLTRIVEASQGASAFDLAIKTIEANGAIADIWTVEDVKENCEAIGVDPLSDEDCMTVLRYVQQDHDANLGINHEVVEHAILSLIAEKAESKTEE